MKIKNWMFVSLVGLTFVLGGCSNLLDFLGLSSAVIDFESVTLPAQGYLDASTASPAHVIDGVKFLSHYDSTYSTSSGVTISSLTDTTTAGYSNPYSAYPGIGADGSAKFAIMNPPYGVTDPLIDFQETVEPKSVFVSNSTYAALSMKDGDAFAKQFKNEDQDYFIVIFEGFDAQGASTGTVKYYLSDFRDGTNKGIVDTWVKVDLSSLGKVREIGIDFESSDVGTYGINTPLYVAIDNLMYAK